MYCKSKDQVDTELITFSLGRAVENCNDIKRDAVLECQKILQRCIIINMVLTLLAPGSRCNLT